jgi:hypothetical protein
MKLKLIALACMTACAGSAFAATAKPNSCTITAASANDVTSQNQLVNKCAPEITFFVGGASAQANALKTVLTTNGAIFNTALPFVKVRDVAQTISGTGSSTTTAAAGKDYNTIAYIGYGASSIASIAGKRVMVVYNKANGSFAGVNTLLTGKGGASEETTLVTTTATEQATTAGKATACTLGTTASTSSYDAIPTYDCTTEAAISTGWGADKQKVLHLALSDVRPSEAVPGVVAAWKPASFPATGTGMQGFGIAVNVPLYQALIAREVAANRMATGCTSSETFGSTYVLTADCQPSLSPAEYTALTLGKIDTATALLGSTDAKTITLNRRAKTSGTQAASEAFFNGRALYNAKATATDGYLEPLGGVAGTPVVQNGLTVNTWSTTDNVVDAIRGEATNYALGVVSLDKGFDLDKANGLKGALWVKLAGVSPMLSKDGTGATVVDKKTKVGFAQGYPFVYEAQAVKSAKLSGAYLDIFNKIVGTDGLTNTSVSLNGVVAKSVAPFTRGDSNFYPLTKY